ncbi:MAG: hypothetical protein R2857_01770 [Vampirovibrionales bacterium]
MTAAASPNTRIEPASHATSGSEVLIGGCPVSDLARQFGTPLYVLDQASLTGMARAYQAMLDTYPGESLVLFAAKAHCNMGLCQLMQQLDCGLDLVSGGEVHTARQAGFNLANTLFNGNNKSDDELAYALAHGVGLISVDNATELEQLARVAMANGRHATILLRVAPGIECHTHDYIKTGHLDSKFGFDLSQIDAALKTISTANSAGNSPVLTLAGLHAHIGSQIFELQPYQDLATTMLAEYERIRRQHGLVMTHIDLGADWASNTPRRTTRPVSRPSPVPSSRHWLTPVMPSNTPTPNCSLNQAEAWWPRPAPPCTKSAASSISPNWTKPTWPLTAAWATTSAWPCTRPSIRPG